MRRWKVDFPLWDAQEKRVPVFTGLVCVLYRKRPIGFGYLNTALRAPSREYLGRFFYRQGRWLLLAHINDRFAASGR